MTSKFEIGSKVSSSYYGKAGTVVGLAKPGLKWEDGNLVDDTDPMLIIEHKAIFADFGPTWLQTEAITYYACNWEVA
jgi:hypothetical protein